MYASATLCIIRHTLLCCNSRGMTGWVTEASGAPGLRGTSSSEEGCGGGGGGYQHHMQVSSSTAALFKQTAGFAQE
jgi:hypothetical protein